MVMDSLTRTRVHLHGIAEGVLAGPQYLQTGTIRLAVSPDGISTTKGPIVTLTADGLRLADGTVLGLAGSFDDLAGAAGVRFGAPDIYSDHAEVQAQDLIDVAPDDAARLLDGLASGDRALREFAPEDTPVLWPEHFDVGISVDEVNYGVSPGDSFSSAPYAYVGPWDFDSRSDDFFNAPFGATLNLSSVGSTAELVAFFDTGRRRWLR